MCDSLYQLLLQYFDSGIGQPNRQEIELNACRYAIIFLVPATENRIVKCDLEYQPQYYKLYEKSNTINYMKNQWHLQEEGH